MPEIAAGGFDVITLWSVMAHLPRPLDDLRMLRGLSALRDDERFGPWVYQVARSAIADHLRSRARHPLALLQLDAVVGVKGGGLFRMKGAEADVVPAAFLERDRTPDELDDVLAGADRPGGDPHSGVILGDPGDLVVP